MRDGHESRRSEPTPAPEISAWVALGSNLGDRRRTIERALEFLVSTGDVQVARRSRLLETTPVGGPPQGMYLNGVAEVRTSLGARALLERLLDTERELGRVRSVPDAPRTLDLDLLLYAEQVIDQPGLQVPHPRMLERAFVLEPLRECAPDLRHPVSGRTVAEHHEELRGSVEA